MVSINSFNIALFGSWRLWHSVYVIGRDTWCQVWYGSRHDSSFEEPLSWFLTRIWIAFLNDATIPVRQVLNEVVVTVQRLVSLLNFPTGYQSDASTRRVCPTARLDRRPLGSACPTKKQFPQPLNSHTRSHWLTRDE